MKNNKSRKRVIMLGIITLIIAAVVGVVSFTRSSLAQEEEATRSEVEYGEKIRIVTSINEDLNKGSYYGEIKYLVTNKDESITKVHVESKSTKYSYPVYSEDMPIVVGENVLMSSTSMGQEIQTITTEITFYNNLGEVALSTTTMAGTVEVEMTAKNPNMLESGVTMWEAPATGKYKFELWGAQGNYFPAYNKENAGKGAYTSGEIELEKGEILYIYTGGNTDRAGDYYDSAFNGGSITIPRGGGHSMSSGGGATDIRYFGAYEPTEEELKWDSELGLRSRIMVAGGGGGTLQQRGSVDGGRTWFRQTGQGGSGGGLVGLKGKIINTNETTGVVSDYTAKTKYPLGGRQTAGGQGGGLCTLNSLSGSFGSGGNGGLKQQPDNLGQCIQDITNATGNTFEVYLYSEGNIGGGGGGGYYGGGGGAAAYDCHSGGAGGSSYVSGYLGSVAVDAEGNPICTEEEARNDVRCSAHYSGKTFDNTEMIDGEGYKWDNEKQTEQTGQPSASGGTQTGNEGVGTYRITLITEEECTNCGGTITLTKYRRTYDDVDTTEKVGQAVYGLYREDDSLVGKYVTDGIGEIKIYNLVIGKKYYLKEMEVPVGYDIDPTKYNFTVTEEEQNFVSYDKELPGSVSLTKYDNQDNTLEDVIFELYKADDTLLGEYTTNFRGQIVVENLAWGDYYFKEKATKQGYVLDDSPQRFTIDARVVIGEVRLTMTNEQARGSVVLTKTNEAGDIKLSGAKYNLYTAEGAIVKENLETDSEGQIRVDNLDWQGYYLKEVEAPEGYGLSDEVLRFTVNKVVAGKVQYLEATDPELKKDITIKKEIKVNEYEKGHGDVTFVFELKGTDTDEAEHKYFSEITFTEEEIIAAREDNKQTISKEEKITQLEAGKYTLREIDNIRYEVSGISEVENGEVNEDTVVFDLTAVEVISGKATISNDKIKQDDLSHATHVTNIVKAKAKLTAIVANYKSTEKVGAGHLIDRDLLEVIAIYDDGTSKVLGNEDYKVELEEDRFPLEVDTSGVIGVNYTEDEITRKDTFIVNYLPYRKVFITPNGAVTIKNTSTGKEYTTDFSASETDVLEVSAGTNVKLEGEAVEVGSTYTVEDKNVTYTGDLILIYNYTGDYQLFTAPFDGIYTVELWGAQGAGSDSSPNKGAYTKGTITLTKGDKFYVYVGEQGISGTFGQTNGPVGQPGRATFNGGGSGGLAGGGGGRNSYYSGGPSGGGATDIRYFGDTTLTDDILVWSSELGLNSRVMVAGAGGATSLGDLGIGAGGALTGYNGGGGGGNMENGTWVSFANTNGKGASQIGGGAGGVGIRSSGYGATGGFGIGGRGSNTGDAGSCFGHGGGGGGYYGGGGAGATYYFCYQQGGGGGSSFISGYKGSVAITSSTNRAAKCTAAAAASDVTCSYHYSDIVFIDTAMTAASRVGNGYAVFTFKGE